VGAVQVSPPSLLQHDETATSELHFIVPQIRANEVVEFSIQPALARDGRFEFSSVADQYVDLEFDGRPVFRYMHEMPDWSTTDTLAATYKVYHHAFSPDGSLLLTKGPGGRFPHHRGIFFGFNRISYGDGLKADIWHCRNKETQEHREVLQAVVGNVMGRHRLRIDWFGRDREVFAHEARELTAFNVSGGTLLEFTSRLETNAGPIKLDGDPQHAGFQFRATQHVPDHTQEQTYYVRPDGVGEPGKYRNWPANKEHVNLPWNAMSIVVNETRYTICYLDHPGNPKEARFSERNYGRFGSYFEYELTETQPLELRYRLWIQEGEMTVADVANLSRQFVEAPTVQLTPSE